MKNTTQKMIISALFTAVIFVLTRVVNIPSMTSVGNINLGDCAVLLAAWMLPYRYAFLAAGIGSALADLLSPYAIYAPATFLIKGLMAITAGLIHRHISRISSNIAKAVISGIAAELIMTAGYFLFEGTFICGYAAALLNIPFNAVQGAAGLVSGALLFSVFKRVKL